MFTVPIGGFSAIIYVIILFVGTLVRRSRRGTLGPLGSVLLHLIDRENDGPWRRAFAYSVASGMLLMFSGVFGAVVMDEARAFSAQYPTGKIFYSSMTVVREIGQEIRGGIALERASTASDLSSNTGVMSAALCAGICGDGP